VAFVSINQIAEPATLHSDQTFLFAEPPVHILPPPPSAPSFPFGNIPTDVEGNKVILKEK